jgi:hypothetical protein
MSPYLWIDQLPPSAISLCARNSLCNCKLKSMNSALIQ